MEESFLKKHWFSLVSLALVLAACAFRADAQQGRFELTPMIGYRLNSDINETDVARYSQLQFADAATWQAKVVELKPTDVDSRLILGVAYFDDNQFDNAKAQWLKAAELDPTSPDPHYNLGFLYLSLDPPDPAAAEAAWRRVIALAPGSEIADTVESHIQSLDASPSPTPTPSK